MGAARLNDAKPEEWEIIAWRIHDRLEAERKRGKVAAEQLAQRALEAIEEKQTVSRVDEIMNGRPAQPAKPKPKPTRTAAEIRADTERIKREMAESAERTRALLATQAPTALETIEKLATERAQQTGRERAQCYVDVLAERPDLYTRYCQEQGAQPRPAAPSGRAAGDLLDQLAKERAASDGLDYAAALQKVAAERPALYQSYLEESR